MLFSLAGDLKYLLRHGKRFWLIPLLLILAALLAVALLTDSGSVSPLLYFRD